jgi:exonuclease SbcC
MIPLKIQLRNFMCYRELDSLDFSGIRLACLAGDNGHGKSALLDAMTWALWGKARAKRDDALIHLGQTEMEVEFEFALGENRYRVIRKRDSHGRGRSSLELQVRDDHLFRPLTEPTMRETQARINRILRMDYETFINSAFLLQGRADEFTIKPPGERKRILGEILGLSLYDQYEERAKERAKARESEVQQIVAQIREMERELERKPEYEKELEQAQADVENLNAALRGAEEKLRKLREEWKELDLKRGQIEELSARLAQGERELAEIEEQMATCEERLTAYEAVIQERQFIEKGFASLTAARQLHESLNEKLAQLVKLNQRKGQLETAITEAKHALALEQRLCSEKVRELSALAQELESLEAKLDRVRAELRHLAQRESEREAKQQETGKLSNEKASLRTRNEQLKSEMDSLKDKSGLLQAAEADCPLCGQELSEEDRVRLVEQFSSEMAESEALYHANQAKIEELTAQGRTLEQEIEAIGRELATRGAQQKQEATLEKSLAEAKGAAEELVKQQEKLTELDERLTHEKYAQAEHAELAELLRQIGELGYDPGAHQEVRRDLEVLNRFEADQAKLKAALDRVDEERASLERLRKSKARWQENLAADLAKKAALAQELTRLPELTTRLEGKSKEVDELRSKEARARQVLGAARQKLDYCDYLTKEREKKLKQRRQVAEEKAIYDELRLAFGKRPASHDH